MIQMIGSGAADQIKQLLSHCALLQQRLSLCASVKWSSAVYVTKPKGAMKSLLDLQEDTHRHVLQ